LHRLDDVAEVQRSVGVGQGAGDEDLSGHAEIIAQGYAPKPRDR
jgi:hypothetical protein